MSEKSAHRLDMENITPPNPPKLGPEDARIATLEDYRALSTIKSVKSIAGAAALYRGSCKGSDAYANNCAHYLSDAFLRAGFNELHSEGPCINARCNTAEKRPIRAREMWCWFKDMANETSNTLPSGTGFWSIFQLDESAYWGGHVLIYDSDKKVFFGTGHYPHWEQFCYKW